MGEDWILNAGMDGSLATKRGVDMIVAPDAVLPSRARSGDAGLDLHCIKSFRIYPGEISIIDTGIQVEVPSNCVGKIESRSGLATKGITVLGGIIDSGYRGPLKVILANVGKKYVDFEPGKAIAQLVIYPIVLLEPNVVETLSETDRGDGGLGHTGR